MFKKYYIAYGSNLNTERMRLRCPDSELVGTAMLRGYRMLYKGKWHDAYLTIERAKKSRIPVVVWRISRRDELMMDQYEGFPCLYYKKELTLPMVECGSRRLENVTAYAYIMYEDQVAQLPAGDYVEECREGYRDFGFDPAPLQDALRETRKRLGNV